MLRASFDNQSTIAAVARYLTQASDVAGECANHYTIRASQRITTGNNKFYRTDEVSGNVSVLGDIGM